MRVTRRLALAVLIAGASAALSSQATARVGGVVFDDRNANGARDPGEPGLSGIAVSNQQDVVISGADGAFSLPSSGVGVVFVSVPSARRSIGAFWRPTANGPITFALAPQVAASTFSFMHASDPHVSQAGLPRLQRARAIAAERNPSFVLMSGDLVRDSIRVGEEEARGYYDIYVNEIRNWPMAVWNVPGNHENFGIERHLSLVSPAHPLYGKGMYRQRLGPNYYSFSYGAVHFVGLDSVDIDDLWYYGHIDQVQLAWLKADLAAVPPGTTIVTFNHIPFVSAMESVNGLRIDGAAPSTLTINGKPQYRHTVSNLADVLPLLKPFRWTHALGGHLHIRETIRFASSTSTRFYQAAAIVGPGEGNVPAISGVTLYRVQDGAVDEGEFIPLDRQP